MRELMLDNGQWLRGPLLVGLVLGLIGPFGTYDLLPLSVRLVYWTAIITLNWALCDIAARWLDQLLPRDLGGRSTAVIIRAIAFGSALWSRRFQAIENAA